MFEYRKSDNNAIQPIPDFEIDAAFAATNPVQGQLVKLNGANQVIGAAAGDATILGVFEGFNVQRETESPKTGKVRTSPAEWYEADFTGGTPVIGTKYNITATSQVNVAAVTTPAVTVVKTSPKPGKVYVKIHGRQLG